MLKKTLKTWLMLVLMVALVTACSSSPSPLPTAVEENPSPKEVMMDEDKAGEEMMTDDETGEEMMADEETMAEDEAGEQMMDEDKSGEEMLADEEMMVENKSDEEMMDEDKPGEEMMADDEMMAEDKSDEEMMDDEETKTVPDWFKVELTDVNTGETFRIADFKGKVVLLETMAIWCPTCARQQQEVQALHEMLGDRDDFISVSLDVDTNESEDMLQAYADQHGFDWNFAVSPREVNRALGNLYSAQYLNPPLAPMMIIDRQGQVYGLPFGGVKKASNLKTTVESYLNGE